MTTKKELREALRRLLDTQPGLACNCPTCLPFKAATRDARAILARPVVVVGYRVRGSVSGRAVDFKLGETSLRADERPYVELWECMADAMGYQEDNGGVMWKLVRR